MNWKSLEENSICKMANYFEIEILEMINTFSYYVDIRHVSVDLFSSSLLFQNMLAKAFKNFALFYIWATFIECARRWEKPIKCFVGNTNVRNQWKVEECPSYSKYCVKVQIGT